MKIISTLIIILLLLLSSCQNKKHEHKHSEKKHHHKKGNEVNKHMHNTKVSDLIKRFESPERDAYQQPEKVLDYIGDVKGKKILDIGAGSGYFSVKLVKRGAFVIAGDVDDEFLDYMKTRIIKDKINSSLMEVRKLPYTSPALKKEEVNKVLIVNTYHHIENRVEYFTKVLNGLKENGELIVIDFFKKELPIGPKPDHKVSKEDVVKELKQAGFKTFEVNTNLLEMQYIIRAN
jgi:cyclopropane fatty-acyl-phospholipid synthase-like methyltransferase